MNKNLEIWNSFGLTPEKFTHNFRSTWGKSISTIDSMWQIKKMTEVFGPIGHGWGWINTPTLQDNLYMANVSVWTKTKENIYGPISVVKDLKKFGKFDEHASKSAITDALTKALSHLGICNDIFLGIFEDVSYVDYQSQVDNKDVKKAEAPIKKPKEEYDKEKKDDPSNWSQDWESVFDFRNRRFKEIDRLDFLKQQISDIGKDTLNTMQKESPELYQNLVKSFEENKQRLLKKGGSHE